MPFEPPDYEADLIRKVVADFEMSKKLVEPHLPEIAKVIAAAQEAAKLVSDGVFARALETAAQLAEIQKRMAAGMALEQEFLPKLAKHGWLISPLSRWDEPQRLHALYKQGGIEAVEADLLGSIDASDFRALVEDIVNSLPAFAAWAPTFAKAVAAMERGDHELAIPIWLAAIDGICQSELAVDVYKHVPRPKRRRSMGTKLAGGTAQSRREPMVEAWLEVLLGFSTQENDANSALLNRHAVMHGKRPEIGTRRDAIQCLLALQVLAYLLSARDRLNRVMADRT